MALSEDERLGIALKRIEGDVVYAPGYPEYAKRIQEEYNQRRFNRTGGGVTSEWEDAGQIASKLNLVMITPEKSDPDGSKRLEYEERLKSFDLESGTFIPRDLETNF